MQLHGLSVQSAASTPSTGIFEPVSGQDDSSTPWVPSWGCGQAAENLFGVSRGVGSVGVKHRHQSCVGAWAVQHLLGKG